MILFLRHDYKFDLILYKNDNFLQYEVNNSIHPTLFYCTKLQQ